MSNTATGSARVLFAQTVLSPVSLAFDQPLEHLSHLVIIVHVIVLVEALHKLLHALVLANDRSKRITRNRRNSDCRAIADSACWGSHGPSDGPTNVEGERSSGTCPTVRRNCPGSHTHRRASTERSNVDPVVPMDPC